MKTKQNKTSIIVCGVLAVILAFTFIACSSGGGGGTPQKSDPFAGTWTHTWEYEVEETDGTVNTTDEVQYTILIKNGTWALTSIVLKGSETAVTDKGTYEVSGKTATFTSIDYDYGDFQATFVGKKLIFEYPKKPTRAKSHFEFE